MERFLRWLRDELGAAPKAHSVQPIRPCTPHDIRRQVLGVASETVAAAPGSSANSRIWGLSVFRGERWQTSSGSRGSTSHPCGGEGARDRFRKMNAKTLSETNFPPRRVLTWRWWRSARLVGWMVSTLANTDSGQDRVDNAFSTARVDVESPHREPQDFRLIRSSGASTPNRVGRLPRTEVAPPLSPSARDGHSRRTGR